MHTQFPSETWPDELRRLPEIYHPDGRRLINNNLLHGLFGITDSAVRERRRQGTLPQSIYKDGNRHFSDLQVIANAYLREFPDKVIEPAPPPPTDIRLTAQTQILTEDQYRDEGGQGEETDQDTRQTEPSGEPPNTVRHSSDQRQIVRQPDVNAMERIKPAELERLVTALTRVAEQPSADPNVAVQLTASVEAVQQLLGQILSMEKESDGQLTALTATVLTQSRTIEEQQAEIRRLREASDKPSEARQGFWARIFGGR